MPDDQEIAYKRDESIHRVNQPGRGSQRPQGQGGVTGVPDETNFQKMLEEMRKNGIQIPPLKEIKK